RRDLALINREGIVNTDSNYCFGEGGAGTYSDGKLYTRVKDKAAIARVLETLVAHGAHGDILVDAHPHIGSNRLPQIVAAMRESIRSAGGEIHFESRVTDFIIEDNRIRGALLSDGRAFEGDATILASGHSGREIYELLARKQILLEPKPFAMGVRIEHPQPLIDRIQYRNAPAPPEPRGNEWRHPKLPAASYRLAHTVEGRGVFSFCMCPGGWIVPSATAPDEVVVNGMSLSRRDSPFANSGMVVSVETEDLAPYAAHGDLAGMAFQRDLEILARNAGGNAGATGQQAPAQRVTDFLAGRLSSTLPKCSYQPGIVSAPLHEVLPTHFAARLQAGLTHFGKTMRGYVTEEAILVGVESRTSSPVRVPRDGVTLEHPQLQGLFPCGEGAGYAGGIVSAAIDGARSAGACVAKLAP
ncbi:MAG TPA: FAD-binding protein, partial [Abditibacteriaceae bacterium]